jgi:AcrR family transcriptional regulator
MATLADVASVVPVRREPLSRERIVEAALELVDERGLDALSLRGVAARLGVTPMPLYRHVANGDELADLVVAALLAREEPSEDLPEDLPEDIEEFLRTVAWRTRTTLLKHPAVFDALRRRALTAGSAVTGLEHLLHVFERAGLTAADAVAAYSAVLMHVLGNVALVHGRRATLEAEGRSESEERARVVSGLAALDTERFPLVSQHGSEVVRLLDDDVFAWGLEAVLAGLQTTLGVTGK